MHHRRAFTLIELLVVIAIIAILAAILFPVFAQAREKARQTTCLSNSKQQGTSVMMYAQDFDEHVPPWWVPNTAPHTPAGWGGIHYWYVNLIPYIKNVQVFQCPSAAGPSAYSAGGQVYDIRDVFDPNEKNARGQLVKHWLAGTGGYGWNACFISTHAGIYGATSGNPLGMSLAQITEAAGTIMIGEISKQSNPAGIYLTKRLYDMIPRTTAVGCGYPGYAPVTRGGKTYPGGNREYRHNQGANVTFFDGHSKWYKEDHLEQSPNLWIAAK